LTLTHIFDMFVDMKTPIFKGLALSLLVAMAASPLMAQTASTDTASAPTASTTTTTDQQSDAMGSDAGYGVGSVLANVFYMPAKVTYAGLGLLAGGLGYVLSGGRSDVANNIIYPAVGGNYVVTPSHLKGTQPIYFVGAPPPESVPPADQSAQSSGANSTATR
jgi:hypothetical protein